MAHRDLDADRILARVGVFDQKIAAGMLHVAHQARRRIDAALLAHEADGAVAVDGKAFDVRNSRTKALFHLTPSLSGADLRFATHLDANSRSECQIQSSTKTYIW